MFANFFFPKLLDFVNGAFFGGQTEYFRKIFWESINEREKVGVKNGDAIDFLINLKNQIQDFKFSKFSKISKICIQNLLYFC